MEIEAQKPNRPTRAMRTTLRAALQALEANDPDRAARLLTRARASGDRDFAARDLLLARTLAHSNRTAQALTTIDTSLAKRELSDEERLEHCVMRGDLLLDLGLPKSARRPLETAVELAESESRADLAARARALLGVACSGCGEHLDALRLLEEAKATAESIDESALVPWILAQTAMARFHGGDLDTALADAKRAVDLPAKAAEAGRALAYRQIGIIEGFRCRFFDALAAHGSSLEIYNRIRFVPGIIRGNLGLGAVYLDMGDVGLARHFMDRALGLSEDSDNTFVLGTVHGHLGGLALLEGEPEAALRHFEEQSRRMADVEIESQRACAERNVGTALRALGRYRDALVRMTRAHAAFVQVHDDVETAITILEIATVEPLQAPKAKRRGAEKRGRPTEVVAKVVANNPRALSRSHAAKAAALAADDLWDDAAAEARQAAAVLERHSGRLLAADALSEFGKLALERGEPRVAEEILRQALRLADVNGYVGLGRAIVVTLDRIDPQIAVEYSKDKEALRRLGDPSRAAESDLVRAGRMVAGSRPMRQLLEDAEDVALADVPVLIAGETGTGKELVARFIYERGGRAGRAWQVVNCGAIPGPLVESTLFGHVRGSFTDAREDRIGALEAADRGVLFLDEVGELKIEQQPALLRFLENKEIVRVGATEPRTVDVRVICATNRNLWEDVARGRFREDLFYRIAVCCLSVPPLRERGSDIIEIARGVLSEMPLARQKGIAAFSREAERRLLDHPWPGNVRELVNAVTAAVVRAEKSKIMADDIRFIPRAAAVVPRDEAIFEQIRKALDSTGGNQIRAAELLGMHRNTLRNWLKKMGEAGV